MEMKIKLSLNHIIPLQNVWQDSLLNASQLPIEQARRVKHNIYSIRIVEMIEEHGRTYC